MKLDTQSEIVDVLKNKSLAEVSHKADQLRAQVCGDEVHRRGLIEFSNYCKENCHYCGLRRDNQDLQRYRMSEDEILASAQEAKKLGYRSVVLQSGEDRGFKTDALCRVVEKIKKNVKVAITLSVGEKSFGEYRALKEAGADRYLMRFETSNPMLYKKLRPGSELGKRLELLEYLRQLDYQVGSGCMVGLPSQSLEDLANDLLLLKKLDLDMVGVGPFIPNPKTPLKDEAQCDLELILKFLALIRLITVNTHIPATTALGSIHPKGREWGLQGGANVIMPNVTPRKYRALYELYPNKICIDEQPSDCAPCVGSMIHALGRKVAKDEGHSLKRQKLPVPQ